MKLAPTANRQLLTLPVDWHGLEAGKISAGADAKTQLAESWGTRIVTFLLWKKQRMPQSPLTIGQALSGMHAWTTSCQQHMPSVGLVGPGFAFLCGQNWRRRPRRFFFWRDEGREARALDFSVDVSLPSIRKQWRRLWVGFEVLETFSKSWSARAVLFLKCEAVVKAGGKQGDAGQNAASYQM